MSNRAGTSSIKTACVEAWRQGPNKPPQGYLSDLQICKMAAQCCAFRPLCAAGPASRPARGSSGAPLRRALGPLSRPLQQQRSQLTRCALACAIRRQRGLHPGPPGGWDRCCSHLDAVDPYMCMSQQRRGPRCNYLCRRRLPPFGSVPAVCPNYLLKLLRPPCPSSAHKQAA